MSLVIRQSTSIDVAIGPFLDETDGKTAETALTITQPDIRLKKNGAAWAQKNAAQTLAHEENGYYEVTLDATDTNTVGILIVAVHEAGALPVWQEYQVVEEAVYDSIYAAGAAALSTLTAAQVNTEVLDVLTVDTFALPGQEAPAATNTIKNWMAYLFKAFRNKLTVDATTIKLFADDGTTVDQKATVSDDGTTYLRGELGSGP